MRDIRCRGKREDNGEWIFGFYAEKINGTTDKYEDLILVPDYLEYFFTENVQSCFSECKVIPETVGQYTGIDDFFGDGICEDDIVTVKVTLLGHPYANKDLMGIVKMQEGCWKVVNNKEQWDFNLWDETNEIKVIGNIHENKELLGEVE